MLPGPCFCVPVTATRIKSHQNARHPAFWAFWDNAPKTEPSTNSLSAACDGLLTIAGATGTVPDASHAPVHLPTRCPVNPRSRTWAVNTPASCCSRWPRPVWPCRCPAVVVACGANLAPLLPCCQPGQCGHCASAVRTSVCTVAITRGLALPSTLASFGGLWPNRLLRCPHHGARSAPSATWSEW